MKKTLKALVLALVIGLVVISLTGCGGNKLVATKTVEDEMQGNYKERVEITFKKDKVEAMKKIYQEIESVRRTNDMYWIDLGVEESVPVVIADNPAKKKELTALAKKYWKELIR